MEDHKAALLEATSSTAIFCYSMLVYCSNIVSINWVDVVLLAVGSFLPTRIGIKVGSVLGLLIGPHLKFPEPYRWETAYSPAILNTIEWIGNNGKIILGLAGGIVGAIIFAYIDPATKFQRLVANLVSAAALGLLIGLLMGFYLFFVLLGNAHPPPPKYTLPMLFESFTIGPLLAALTGLWVGFVSSVLNMIPGVGQHSTSNH